MRSIILCFTTGYGMYGSANLRLFVSYKRGIPGLVVPDLYLICLLIDSLNPVFIDLQCYCFMFVLVNLVGFLC